MSEVACCAPDVPCAPPLQPAQLNRVGPAEECFCIDAAGLAQGHGIFRTHHVDVPVAYSSSVRILPSASHPLHFINSDSAFAAVAAFVVLLALTGRRAGLRALGVVALSVIAAAAAGAVGPFLGVVLLMVLSLTPIDLGYSALGVPGLVAIVTATAGFVLTLRALLRARAAEPAWALMLAILTVALTLTIVGLRASDLAQAYAALDRAPTLVWAVRQR